MNRFEDLGIAVILNVERALPREIAKLTVDTYGRWPPMGNTAAMDRLDDIPAPDTGGTASRR